MKALIALVCLFTFMAVQADTVSPKALLGIESRIELQRDLLNEKLDHVDTSDITEGKIVAAMVNLIEEKLSAAEKSLDAISSDEMLTDENIASINSMLDDSEQLINEI